MKITSKTDGKKVVLYIEGIVDNESSNDLNQVLQGLSYDNLDLTLDFDNTEYITSAGLRVLLIARKKLTNDTMRLININDAVEEVLKITGFDNFIKYSKKDKSDNLCRLSFKTLLSQKKGENYQKTAIVFNDEEYTWEDIDKCSQIIANDLSKMGVTKGTHVGICAPNSINWIFTFFAIQKLGGIATLVNFKLKTEEIKSLISIGDISVFCYGVIPKGEEEENFKKELLESNTTIKQLYKITNDIDFRNRLNEYQEIQNLYSEKTYADDASVIIFTSGSTGKVKAVMLSSYNILQTDRCVVNGMHVNSSDRVCAYLPFFHIFALGLCLTNVLVTNSVAYIPNEVTPASIIELIKKYKITFIPSVPTLMLGITKLPTFDVKDGESLLHIVLGGAGISAEQTKYLISCFPKSQFFNVYGMSENPIVSMTQYGDTIEHIATTIGKPVDGAEVQIRNVATREVLKNGEVGEIVVRSASMILCYYKLALEDQPLDDEGFLATGDLGFFDEQGYLHITGRIKDLIIRGGENISPNEIANVMLQLPEIAEVKVVGISHEILGEEVVAGIVVRNGYTFDEKKVTEFLSTKLAKYKIPTKYVVFSSFPILGTGKVDGVTIKKQIMEKL